MSGWASLPKEALGFEGSHFSVDQHDRRLVGIENAHHFPDDGVKDFIEVVLHVNGGGDLQQGTHGFQILAQEAR